MKKLLLIMGVVLLHFNSLAQCANSNNIHSFTINGTNYELVRENQTWTQAAACAVARGGFLAHIESAAENTAIFNVLSSPAAGINLARTVANDGGGGSYVWLGGNDLRTEGTWVWNGTNSPFIGVNSEFWRGIFNARPIPGRYQNWGIDDRGSQAEPDNSQNQDALGIALTQWPVGFQFWLGTAGQWNDVDAGNRLYYLIEFPPCSETSSNIDETSCGTYTSPSGKEWRISDTYNDTIPNAAGCDSVITINLTIKPNSSSFQTVSACDSLESPDGEFWTESGIYNHTIPNAIGCDSIIIYEVKITKASDSNISESACGTYTSPSGKLWTVSGIYNDTIDNAVGCDSVITINLTILSETYNSVSESACNAYTSPSGKVWTTSGTYNDTIDNGAGCDSVITINLTILSSTRSVSNINSCSAFTSPSGKIWTTSGTSLDTVDNAAGCDSIMTFNLTIISVDNKVTKNKDTLIASSGGSYQWLDCENNFSVISGATNQRYIPNQDGEYAVEVTESGCMDTSECVSFVLSSVEGLNEEQIVIYPNPTSDVIQIMMENGQQIEGLSVYDVSGKKYEVSFTKSQNKYEVNLKDLPSGNYVLVIDSQGHQIRRQVQKL